MKNKNDNYLDYVFQIKENLPWSVNDQGQVICDMENTGFTNKIAQKFFHKPKISHITLEGMGSFIFQCIDGTKSIYDIGRLVHEEFGDEAEPLYERLSVYIKKLEELNFIEKI